MSQRPAVLAGEASADAGRRQHTSGGRATAELILVGLGALAVSLAQSVLIPVLGDLQTTYGSSANWLVTSTLLVAAVSVPIMGRLGDMFGKRLMLLIALGCLVAGSLIDALTSQIGLLIVGRAIQGASSAAIPLGISLMATLMPRERAGSAVATISAMLGVGSALGLPVAGLIAEHADWHVLFWITAVAGAVAFLGILLVVPESEQRGRGRVDVVGSILLSIGLVALILPLEQSSDWGWGSPRVWGLLIAAVVVIAVFALVELRRTDPLVDITALRRRPIATTNLASICFGFALFASFIGTTAFVEAGSWTGYGLGKSLFIGGITLLPSGVAMLVLAPVASRMIARRGPARTLAVGGVLLALGWVARIFLSDDYAEIIVATSVIGCGTGIGYAAIPSLINAYTPPTEIAAANGMNTLFRSLGSTFASAIGSSILAGSVVYHVVGGQVVDGAPSLTAYRWLFAVCAIAAAAAVAIVLTIPRAGDPDGATVHG
jgi:MFS family permease